MYPCSLCICLAVSVWVLIDHEFISNILPCAVAHVCTLSFEVGGVYLAFVCCESVELCLCFCSMALTSPCATFLLQSARFTCHCWSLSDQLRLWFQLWCTICCGIILRTFTPPGSSCWAWVARVKSLASHSSSSAMNERCTMLLGSTFACEFDAFSCGKLTRYSMTSSLDFVSCL